MNLSKMINLLSKTGLGRSGHVRFQTFGPIWHVSGPKMVFWRNDIMILHHFCWRSSKIKLSTGLRPPRHRALTAISILDMAFAVEPVVWATSQNLNDHAWCNVHASPLDQAGVGPRTASVYIYDGVKKSENGGTIFVAQSLVLKNINWK